MAFPAADRAPAPQVLEGTWLAEEPERKAAFLADVADSPLRPEIWSGAFATNVWGGRYEMEGLLASGSQGTTFFGVDLKTGAKVVVKVFDLGKATDWKSIELFEREAATLKKLEHDRIPSFMDVIEDPESSTRALVMTRVDGANLHQTLKEDGPLTEARLWRVLIDVIEVLSFVHQEGLVHRDLKPKNLIRQKDGEIHLVDFGGVGRVDGQKGSTIVGTFGYMAPEQLYGTTTCATDLYALGATLLTLATGKEPEELPRKGLAIDVDKAVPHLSLAFRELLTRLLTPDPQLRPQTAMEVARSLQGIYDDSKNDAYTKDENENENETKDGTSKQGRRAARAKAKAARRADRAKAKTGRMHESPHTAAVFTDDQIQRGQEGLEDGLSVVGGSLHMVLSIVASVLGVVVGEVLLPLFITLLSIFSSEKTKRELEVARGKIKVGAQKFRHSMRKEAETGARSLNKANQRIRKKDEKRRRRQAEKNARRGRSSRR